MKLASEPHHYEFKKVRMSQDKDGHLVVLRPHHSDANSPIITAPVGAVFGGELVELGYDKET